MFQLLIIVLFYAIVHVCCKVRIIMLNVGMIRDHVEKHFEDFVGKLNNICSMHSLVSIVSTVVEENGNIAVPVVITSNNHGNEVTVKYVATFSLQNDATILAVVDLGDRFVNENMIVIGLPEYHYYHDGSISLENFVRIVLDRLLVHSYAVL